MTKIYIANWATEADFDAERDDSSFDCTGDLAEPRVARLAASMTFEWLMSLCEAMKVENAYISDGDEELMEADKKITFYVEQHEGRATKPYPEDGVCITALDADGAFWGCIYVHGRELD